MSKAAELAALIGSQTALSNRNLIINGAMQVAQRGTSHSQSNPNAGGFHTVDRYAYRRTGTWSGVTAVTLTQESSGAPEGFKNFLRYAPVGSDATTPSGATMKAQYKSEGLSASQLKWGTSNAEAATLSFYVRSTVTGTFNVFIGDDDPASTRTLQVKEYTINSANTWERKTLTFSGPTSGNWPIDNGKIFELVWIISGDNAGGGSTAVTSPDSWTVPTSDTPITSNQTDGVTTSSGQTWDITGIQLEVGEQATPFEHRSFGDELQRCRRYFIRTEAFSYYSLSRWSFSADVPLDQYTVPVEMRAAPSVSVSTAFAASAADNGFAGTPTFGNITKTNFYLAGDRSVSANAVNYLNSGKLDIDAEL